MAEPLLGIGTITCTRSATRCVVLPCLWSFWLTLESCCQIGITPGGCGVFASQGHSPKLTDSRQAILSKALEFVHRGGCIQVDKGYDYLKAYAMRYGVDVAMPIRRRPGKGPKGKGTPYAQGSIRLSRRIARTRVHVER